MANKTKPYLPKEPAGSYVVKEPPAVYELLNPNRYTYADYMSWIDNQRREIINGVVYRLMSAPSRFHAKISSKLLFIFSWFVEKRKGKCEIYHAPFDVRFPKKGETANEKIDTVVQPDICVICDKSK